MTGLDFRHNMDVVRDQNGSYSAHVFADRAVQLVRQHAIYSKGQVSTVTFTGRMYCLPETKQTKYVL